MKKALVILGVVVVSVIISILLLSKVNQYSLDAEVTEMEGGSTIVLEDTTGNIWAYEDTLNKYKVGDIVKITWNDKGTEMKQDDEIIKIEVK